MLEHRRLLLTKADPPLFRRIVDPDSKTPLGFARIDSSGNFLPQWFKKTLLTIHEQEEGPLLCSVSKTGLFSSTWVIRDSDAQQIGLFDQIHLLVSGVAPRQLILAREFEGQFFFFHDDPEDWRAVLINFIKNDALLTFNAALDQEPFTKMAILGAALVSRFLNSHVVKG